MATRFALALALLLSASIAWAQTADEIIEKSLAAMGGRAAHEKLKSRLTTGTVTLTTPAGDITGSIEVWNAPPNKLRLLMKADLTSLGAGPMVMDQRFDGHTGYVIDTLQGNREITGSQLDNLKNNAFPHIFMNYKAMGTTATLKGKEKVGDRESYLIVFDPTSGSEVRQYIDAETFLPNRTVVKAEIPQIGRELEQTSDLLEYKDVDGIKIPHRIRISSEIQTITLTTTKVEHNVAMDEKLFAKPAQ